MTRIFVCLVMLGVEDAASAQDRVGVVVSAASDEEREPLETVARAALVARGVDVVGASEMRAAVHFLAPDASVSDAVAEQLVAQMRLARLISIATGASDASVTYLQVRIFGTETPITRFARVETSLVSDALARIIAEMDLARPPPEPVAPEPPRTDIPEPIVGEARALDEIEYVLHNDGSADLCRVDAANARGEAIMENLLQDGTVASARAPIALRIPAAAHSLRGYSCRGQRVLVAVIDREARESHVGYRYYPNFPFSLLLTVGFASGGLWIPAASSMGSYLLLPSAAAVFGYAVDPGGWGVGFQARLGAVWIGQDGWVSDASFAGMFTAGLLAPNGLVSAGAYVVDDVVNFVVALDASLVWLTNEWHLYTQLFLFLGDAGLGSVSVGFGGSVGLAYAVL